MWRWGWRAHTGDALAWWSAALDIPTFGRSQAASSDSNDRPGHQFVVEDVAFQAGVEDPGQAIGQLTE